MDTRLLADRVVRQHSSRDPFFVAENLGIIVLCTPLVEMRGFQQKLNRRTLIYINSDLDKWQQRLVCAHELGHHFMHKGLNRIFMDTSTRAVTNKFEIEAHRFSVDFIYDDCDLIECLDCSLDQVSKWMGIPTWLASYRIKSISKFPE